jgi:hypothetical protein
VGGICLKNGLYGSKVYIVERRRRVLKRRCMMCRIETNCCIGGGRCNGSGPAGDKVKSVHCEMSGCWPGVKK